MKLLELSALFCLSTLSLTVKSFSLTHPSRTTIQSSTDSSLCASRNQPDLSRAASFIVGSTIPFLFSLGQDEMKSNQLNLHFGQQHATADSTGKMSTKLTARKRYLPRVKAGVTEFKKLSQSLDTASIAAFEKDSVSFVRAMDLYGVSLRKGETPDEISRKAKQLTDNFAVELQKLEKAKGDAGILTQYTSCLTALDSYLEYAKMPTSSDASYL